MLQRLFHDNLLLTAICNGRDPALKSSPLPEKERIKKNFLRLLGNFFFLILFPASGTLPQRNVHFKINGNMLGKIWVTAVTQILVYQSLPPSARKLILARKAPFLPRVERTGI